MVLPRHGTMTDGFIEGFTEHADEAWVTANGANMGAGAWTDPAFRTRDLWSESYDDAINHVGIFQSDLQKS